MSNFLVGTNLADIQLDKFNGDASTLAFTLSVSSSTFSALVRISGVVQTPTIDFNISGTTLTFTSAPPTGTDNIVVTYTKATQIGVPNDASVSASKLASNAVTTDKILDANITTDKIADNAISLSKMASGTDGNIISYDVSGNPVAVATGTNGQVLTSAGAGAQPAFATLPTSGAWEFISSVTASSSATVSFTNMASGYDYNYTFFNVVPATNTQNYSARLGVAGPTYRTENYVSLHNRLPNSGGYPADAAITGSIRMGRNVHGGTAGNQGVFSGYLEFRDPAAAGTTTSYDGQNASTSATSSGNQNMYVYGGTYTTAEAQTSVQFFFGSGNIASGTIQQFRRTRS